MRRDLVVIGSSAGGVEALPTLLAQMPRDTPAAFALVQHLPAESTGHLAAILQRATPMPVKWAEHGDKLEHGCVYVAPPDRHMQIEGGQVQLVHGARENHARPAINRLFRSVAAEYAGRTIGVLLTGLLDDGVLGLATIQRCGGATIVQDPRDAMFPDMPIAALDVMTPDHVVGLSSMGEVIVHLNREQAPSEPPADDVMLHAALDRGEPNTPRDLDQLGPQTQLTCPDCGGPMWDVGYGRVRGYRCYLGHASGPHALLAGQAHEVERSLWAAIRALQERAATLSDLARNAVQAAGVHAGVLLENQAREAREHAERARRFLLDLQRQLQAR